jgi:hypothetical protein
MILNDNPNCLVSRILITPFMKNAQRMTHMLYFWMKNTILMKLKVFQKFKTADKSKFSFFQLIIFDVLICFYFFCTKSTNQHGN